LTDLLQLLRDEEKGTTLPALLARCIEAYECSPHRATYVLRFRHLLGRKSRAPKQVNTRTSEALSSSDAASMQESFEKTLHLPSAYLAAYEGLLEDWYRGNSQFLAEQLTEDEAVSWDSRFGLTDEELERIGDLFDNPQFRSYLEKDAEYYEANPVLKRSIARELGFDPDIPAFDLLIRMYQKNENESEAWHFAAMRRPQAKVRWAKELVGRIEEITDREAGLDRHPIAALGDTIPAAIRTLFEQAHLCYLFDFDLPCTVMCGALIEQAFEEKFPEIFAECARQYKETKRDLKMWQKIDKVIEKYPRFAPTRQPSNEVWRARTDAIHHPRTYLNLGRYKAEDILRKTSKVLEILFERDDPDEGKK
jgi:hypothetical protein